MDGIRVVALVGEVGVHHFRLQHRAHAPRRCRYGLQQVVVGGKQMDDRARALRVLREALDAKQVDTLRVQHVQLELQVQHDMCGERMPQVLHFQRAPHVRQQVRRLGQLVVSGAKGNLVPALHLVDRGQRTRRDELLQSAKRPRMLAPDAIEAAAAVLRDRLACTFIKKATRSRYVSRCTASRSSTSRTVYRGCSTMVLS